MALMATVLAFVVVQGTSAGAASPTPKSARALAQAISSAGFGCDDVRVGHARIPGERAEGNCTIQGFAPSENKVEIWNNDRVVKKEIARENTRFKADLKSGTGCQGAAFNGSPYYVYARNWIIFLEGVPDTAVAQARMTAHALAKALHGKVLFQPRCP